MSLFTRYFLSELAFSPDAADDAKMRRKYYHLDDEGNPISAGGDMSVMPYQNNNPYAPPAPPAQPPAAGASPPQAPVAPSYPQKSAPSSPASRTPDAAVAPAINPAAARPGGDAFFRDPRNLASGSGVGRPDLDPRVVQWLNKAGQSLGPGWHAELRAGPANHTVGTYTTGAPSQVPKGQAADIDLIDPNGRHIPNPAAHNAAESNAYRNSPDFAPYKKLGDAYIQASGGLGRWGGNYGLADRMQYGTISPGYPAGANANQQDYAQARQNAANGTPDQQQTPTAQNGQPVTSWQPEDYPNAPVESKQAMSNAQRNNPGNLRASAGNDWVGKTTKPGDAFESFDTVQNGLRARALTYNSYFNRGINTINQISNVSGPANDGNNIASQNSAYQQAMGGKYAAPGGENLPLDHSPETMRRLVAGGVSIEAGGGGKWMPQGVNMPLIDSTIANLNSEGKFNPSSGASSQMAANVSPSSTTPPSSTASNAPPPSSTSANPQVAATTPPPQTQSLSQQMAAPIPPPQQVAANTPDQQQPKPVAAESYRSPLIQILRPLNT